MTEKLVTRKFGLDVVRSFAIILVLISHGKIFLPNITLGFGDGFLGVEIFFVLSGFLIGNIVIRDFKSGEKHQLFHFWKRRWFRTLPNYFLLLILNIVIFKHYAFSNIPYFIFSQNLSWPIVSGLMPESWSLAVEEWFYLLFPLLLLVVIKCRNYSYKKSILIVIIAIIIIPPSLRIINLFLNPLGDWDGYFRKIVVLRLDSIGYGVLLAWISFYHENLLQKNKTKLLFIGVFILTSALLTGYVFYAKVLSFCLISIGIMLALPYFIYLMRPNKYIACIFENISKTSYSIYLLHSSFVIPFVNTTNLPNIDKYFLYISLTFILSNILYYSFERPFMNLRDRIKLKKATP